MASGAFFVQKLQILMAPVDCLTLPGEKIIILSNKRTMYIQVQESRIAEKGTRSESGTVTTTVGRTRK